jgi:hypothetical protein
MRNDHSLRALSDDDLLRRLSQLLHESRRNEADLVAHIGEVDERGLYARKATSSMFAYCTQVLHLSEPEAYLRITAARAARQHPVLLTMLADGRLHLSGIVLLAPHLTDASRDAVLARATHRSKRQIEELVAELSPRSDAPERIRKLPEPRVHVGSAGVALTRPEPPASVAVFTGCGNAAPSSASTEVAPGELRPDGVERCPATSAASATVERRLPVPSASVEPIAPGRYKVQFTASAELRDKLERLQALLQTPHSDASLAVVIEAAVSEKLERLEATRLACSRKRRGVVSERETRPKSRHIPAAVRRAVWERDQRQCRFLDREGRRCTERRWLELHHLRPFGVGGDHAVENIRLMCRAHNRYLAEIDFGRREVSVWRARPSRAASDGAWPRRQDGPGPGSPGAPQPPNPECRARTGPLAR